MEQNTNTTPEGIDLVRLEALARAAKENGAWPFHEIAFRKVANPATVLELIALARAAQPAPAGPKDTAESMAENNARYAIDGAIQYGRENRNAPPSTDHWLYEYWNIGQQLRELGKTGWDNVTPLGGDPAQPAPAVSEQADERAGFLAWWPTQGQTIGEVTAWNAWQARAALSHGASSAPADTPAANSVSLDHARALHAAVSALYFDDSSDFRSALGAVVRHLDPALAGEMLGSPKSAYDQACSRLDADRAPATSTATPASVQPAEHLDATGAIEGIADELEAEAMNYEGDFADTVKGCVDALRNLLAQSPTSAQPADVNPLKSTSVDPQKRADAENNGAQSVAAAPAGSVGEVQQSSGADDTRVVLYAPLPIGTKLYAAPAAPVAQAAAPADHKLAPIVPTDDMVVRGFEAWPDPFFSTPEEWAAYEAMTGCQQAAHRARLCWAAMLAAAPGVQVQEQSKSAGDAGAAAVAPPVAADDASDKGGAA